VSGRALRQEGLDLAGRIAAKTGARLIAQGSNARTQRGRVLPDVAAHAQAGYVQVTHGHSFLDGGTSASAPLWAALIGLVNAELQKQKGANARAGYLTPVLYQAGKDGKPIGSAVCTDISVGDNISAMIGGFHAGPGYDAVTGWGSPLGTELVQALLDVV
jgi:kumamolisin